MAEQNKMGCVAGLLSLELMEEFTIEGTNSTFRLTNAGIEEMTNNGWEPTRYVTLLKQLLTGNKKVIKTDVWPPANGSPVFYYDPDSGKAVMQLFDINNVFHLALYGAGLLFKNMSDAAAYGQLRCYRIKRKLLDAQEESETRRRYEGPGLFDCLEA